MHPKCTRNLSFSTNNSSVKRNGDYSIMLNTRALQKVSSHSEYLENRSCGLDVIWQPVQKRPHCASMNSHSPVGLVSQQWDTIDWACVLCDRHIHIDWASRSASSRQCACPFYSSCAGFLGKVSHHPGLLAPLQPRFVSLRHLAFPKAKTSIEREEICECDIHTFHKLSKRCLTADWLAPWDSDCSWIHSKVSSDWLPSYIKAMWPVLKIFKMAGYFPDSPRRTFAKKGLFCLLPRLLIVSYSVTLNSLFSLRANYTTPKWQVSDLSHLHHSTRTARSSERAHLVWSSHITALTLAYMSHH